MRLLLTRAAVAALVVSISTIASAETFYGYCTDGDHSNVISPFWTYEGSSSDYDDIVEQWEAAVSANLKVETYKIRGSCYAATDRAKAESQYNNILGYTDEWLVQFAPKSSRSASAAPKPSPTRDKSAEASAAPKPTPVPTPAGKSAAQLASEEAAAKRAQAKAEFDAKHAEWERQKAAQEQQVADFKRAQEEIARRKAEQAAAAAAATDAYRQQAEAHAALERQHAAEVARYEAEVAAQKVRADFDARHKLGQASTDSDANQCITTPQTKLDDTFKGNTSASIVNGCGKPIDVRICLKRAEGWNCGDRTGVQGQAVATFSTFNATGQVWVDAKVTGSSKVLGRPN